MGARSRVAIIGAGAAGVFTAHRLRALAGDACDLVLVEAGPRVGGNAQSLTMAVGSAPYSIDLGAQFFYKAPQPRYVALIEALGLLELPARIDARATGITLWDRQAGRPRLWLPSQLDGFLRYRPQDWTQLAHFATFLGYAALLDRAAPADWQLSVGQWLSRLKLLDPRFRDEVVRPFLYQFLTMPASRVDEASALYAITYFVRNVIGAPGAAGLDPAIPDPSGGATFQVYQSRVGLDGVLTRALEAAGVVPRLNEPAVAVTRQSDGAYIVTTTRDAIPADHVVFATDPGSAAAILAAGHVPVPNLIASLEACEYADLPIAIQRGGSCWMPGDSRYWEAVNTIISPNALEFTAWFGPLRDPDSSGARIPVFKSWASPALDPAACAHTVIAHHHRVVVPTTTFMRHRDEVRALNGRDGLWFAGGWTTWFDSQEAALESATMVATALAGPPGTDSIARGGGPLPEPPGHTDRAAVHAWVSRVASRAPAPARATLARTLAEIESRG